MHPGAGITPDQIKTERQKLADRQVVAAQVAALLSSAEHSLEKATHAGPLDAVTLIARAFADYMQSQRIQVEMTMKLDAVTLSQLDTIIKQLASPIIQAAPTGQGRR